MTLQTSIRLLIFIVLVLIVNSVNNVYAKQDAVQTINVQLGDTWHALSKRFATTESTLRTLNGTVNRGQQPTIGTDIIVPSTPELRAKLWRPTNGSTALIALSNGLPLPHLAQTNVLQRPYLLPHQSLLILDRSQSLREMPSPLQTVELSQTPATTGQALGLRGTLAAQQMPTMQLDTFTIKTHAENSNFVGLIGLGAFFQPGPHTLHVVGANGLRWSQPLLFVDGTWEFQTISFSGAAAQIDNDAIQAERARLFEIWSQNETPPRWSAEFLPPIYDYLYLSSAYGTRRSYDGGATYRTYHEGVDFAAYGGTPVYATAAGTVVVAEQLYVRGGAVIIDHGLGIYSGVYHLSSVDVAVGTEVQAGDFVGAVGTTGLSTGNHLHWDLLVNETWVGADKWVEFGMGCWLLAGLNRPCAAQ